MALVVIVVVLLATVSALWLGGPNVRSWSSQRDPHVPRDLAAEVTVTALRIGVLLLLLASAAVAVVGSLAAYRGEADLPNGVVLMAVLTVVLAGLVIGTFGRRRNRVTR